MGSGQQQTGAEQQKIKMVSVVAARAAMQVSITAITNALTVPKAAIKI